MSLLDRFRPDWKHTDADVRADAVRQLGPSAKDTLAEIAKNDTDAKIRGIAVRKIEDVALLREIAGSDEDSKVAELAQERAHHLLAAVAVGEDAAAAEEALEQVSDDSVLVQIIKTAESDEIRSKALARISTTADLVDVIHAASDTAIRKEAIGRLKDPQALTQIAHHEQFGEIALAALERIDDPQVWIQLSENAEVKTVREEATRRLDALSDEDHPTRLADRRKRQEELISTAQELAKSSDWEAARDGIEAARSAWIEMGIPEDDELSQQFFGAREEFIQRFKAHLEATTPEATTPEATTPEATTPEASSAPAAEAEESATEEGVTEEVAATETAAEAPPAEAPAAEATDAAASPAAASDPAQTEASGEAQIAAEEKSPDTEAQPEGTPAAGDEAGAASAEEPAEPTEGATAKPKPPAKAEESPERGVARLKSLCDRLSSMVSSDQLVLRKADRALKEAQTALSEPHAATSHEDWPAIKKQLETARDALQPKVRQIEQEEEWKRWANVPLQEALCERMEALIETEDLGHASKELRVLSEEWKTVATVPREKSEELWQRFRGAREKVRERVKVFLQEQDKHRKENLVKKLALCEQAEALADSTEWRDTADKLKALQAEWKAIGPVPRKVSDQTWKRFRAACDLFFNRRKEHFSFLDKEREANLARKTALCEEAETLAESTDWDETTNKYKRLQARWKEIGPVPRKVSDQIWKRFRGACDKFFDRRSRRDELPLEENLQKREEALTQLEALLPKAPTAPTAPTADSAPKAEEAAPKAIEEITEAKGETTEAADTAEASAEPAEAQAPAEGSEEASAATTEEEAPETPTAAEAATEEATAEQATEEAAAEAPPAEPPVPENLAETINTALGLWNTAGEVPGRQRAGLEKRFAEVSTALMGAYPENLEGTPLDPKDLAQKRESLVSRGEALLAELRSELEASKAAPEPSLADLAQQLKEAFAANTIRKGVQTSDSTNTFRKSSRKIEGLRARWNELPGEPDARLAKSFDKIFKDLAKLEKEHED